MSSKIIFIFILCGITLMVFSCSQSDDVPPILKLTGNDSVGHVLNEPYTDQGATAIDETDGTITKNIFVDNTVNINKVGEYTVTYKVVDKAGNEAKPLERRVFVYNEGDVYAGYYNLTETQQYPENSICDYEIFITFDSTVNKRLIFDDFACNFGQPVYTDVADTVIVLPYQIVNDSLFSWTLQGSGSITDTSMTIEYTVISDSINSLWKAGLKRLK